MKKAKSVKLPAGVDQTFVDGIQAMTTDQLKAHVVLLQVQNQENESFKESDEYLQAKEEFKMAKENNNLVVGPVKDLSISIKNKTKLLIERLKEKGGA